MEESNMENKDIHNGLDKKEIRDFLAQWSYREGFLGRGSEIEYLEKQLEEIKERLIHCRNHKAVLSLIESNGWKDFDLDTLVPYNHDTYFPFVGTEKEFEELNRKNKSK